MDIKQILSQKICFCDTNIIRYLIDHPEKWLAFKNYLAKGEMTLTISMIQLLELNKLPRYYQSFFQLLSVVPANIFAWWRNILKDEIQYYPKVSSVNPIFGYIIEEFIQTPSKRFSLKEILESNELNLVWDFFEESKDKYMPVLSWLPSTSPKPGANHDLDFELHNFGYVIGEIGEIDDQFALGFKGNYNKLKTESFKGSYLRAAYTYYRYIRVGMKPERSDLGDIHQIFYFPYCKTVIIEKSMAGLLHQLKKEKGLLDDIDVKSIRFIRELPDS